MRHFRFLRHWAQSLPRALLAVPFAMTVSAKTETTGIDAASRLGFRFDQIAHDAALASRAKDGGEIFLNEPVDPAVIRLPKYFVKERKEPVTENNVLTTEGKVERAKKRQLSPLYQKTLGPLTAVASLINNVLGGWNPNGREATALEDDSQGLRRKHEMSDLNDLNHIAEPASKAEASELLKKPKQ
ncbi:MAG: hypothetical protein ABIZ04_16665 [Opitutus sp.]